MQIEELVAKKLLEKHLTISTAESCTGGLLSSLLTDVSGSSAYITYNVVTYANEIKSKILGVSNEILEKYGAVSSECANAMAIGLKRISNSDICLVTTGIAGPGGGSEDKPVGLCYVGVFINGEVKTFKINFPPETSRKEMKLLFARKSLSILNEML